MRRKLLLGTFMLLFITFTYRLTTASDYKSCDYVVYGQRFEIAGRKCSELMYLYPCTLDQDTSPSALENIDLAMTDPEYNADAWCWIHQCLSEAKSKEYPTSQIIKKLNAKNDYMTNAIITDYIEKGFLKEGFLQEIFKVDRSKFFPLYEKFLHMPTDEGYGEWKIEILYGFSQYMPERIADMLYKNEVRYNVHPDSDAYVVVESCRLRNEKCLDVILSSFRWCHRSKTSEKTMDILRGFDGDYVIEKLKKKIDEPHSCPVYFALELKRRGQLTEDTIGNIRQKMKPLSKELTYEYQFSQETIDKFNELIFPETRDKKQNKKP